MKEQGMFVVTQLAERTNPKSQILNPKQFQIQISNVQTSVDNYCFLFGNFGHLDLTRQ